jgi:hypothetical protein
MEMSSSAVETKCETDFIITKDYILSVINERNSLLICLNQILVNDSKIQLNDDLIHLLFKIYCNHFDVYVKHICGKLLINFLINNDLNYNSLFQFNEWHCFPQLSKLLNDLLNKIPKEECVGYQSLVDNILDKLRQFCETNSLCEIHCLCYTLEVVNHIFSQTDDQNLNNIVLTFVKLFNHKQKRCFDQKFFDLLISIAKDNENKPNSMNSIFEWIFEENLIESINISDQFYCFGGEYLSEMSEKNEFECDVIILRKFTLLYLICLSSQSVIESTNNHIIYNRLRNICRFVRSKCNKMSENNWIIELFIEEDEQLLTALYCILKLNNNQMSHYLMNEFIEAIDCDHSVLLDMLCNDDETATHLLKLLLIYLKLNDITINIATNARNVLLELCHKIERLTLKKLFPYNVKPLLKLLNKLKT